MRQPKKRPVPSQQIATVAPLSNDQSKLRVFVSWSGERSRAVAQTLRDWLPLVVHFIDPWLSQADIEAGERWADAVANELEASNFGIICVTRESINAPWTLFEAGALAKSLQGSRVIPLLFDIDFQEVSGPLAQFQAKKVEKNGLFEVVQSINEAASQPIATERLKQLFEALWPAFEKQIVSIPSQESAAKHARPQAAVLEELVSAVRSLDLRFREVIQVSQLDKRRRSKRQISDALRLSKSILRQYDKPFGLVILGSFFAEEAPWLRELAMEAYRAAQRGNRREARQIVEAMRHILDEFPDVFEDDSSGRELYHLLRRQLDLLDLNVRGGFSSGGGNVQKTVTPTAPEADCGDVAKDETQNG